MTLTTRPTIAAFLLLMLVLRGVGRAEESSEPSPKPAARETLPRLNEQLEAALKDVRLTYQRVFVLLGSLEGGPVLELYEDLHQDDESLANVMQNYRILPISIADPQKKAVRELLQQLMVEPNTIPEQFLVLILDEQGKLLDTAGPSRFYRGQGEQRELDREGVLTWLRSMAPPEQSSREILNNALADAERSGRRVIIQETATWCGPCILLSRYLTKHRALWERDYLWVKLDHRWEDTTEVIRELRGEKSYGIPWWAILDAEGKTLATSIREGDQNIGFPSSDEGKAHFREMLQATAVRLQPEQIEILIDDLK